MRVTLTGQRYEVEDATHTVHASPTLAAYLAHLTTFLSER